MIELFSRLLESEMLTNLFLKILNMSISATWLVGAVLLLRLALKKAPKWVNVLLWGMVALRLLCPFTLESALSLMPKAQVVTPGIMMSHSPAIDSGIAVVDQVVNPILSESFTPHPSASANPLQILIPVYSLVWLMGITVMGAYTLVSYWHLRQRVRMAIRVEPDIYLSEYVDSPFVLGLFRPRIYMPYHMTETDRRLVLSHERSHIRRKDHWWKPLGFALLTLHWFNPVMWAAYVLLCRDIELACDERVIQEMEPLDRADYSQALLNCSAHRRAITACPLAFGEVGVTERVRNVLNYKKPAFWVVVIAVILCIAVAVCFLTDPSSDLPEQILKETGYRVLWETKAPYTDFVIHKYDYSAQELVNRKNDLGMFHGMYYVTPGSMICLKEAQFPGGNQETLQLTFYFSYDQRQQKNRIRLPYTLTEDGHYQYTLSLLSKDVTDKNGNVFPDACYLSGFGPGEEFTITMKTEVWDQAQEEVCFSLDGFRDLFYREDGLFSDKTPYPITRNLAYYRAEIQTAQLSLWEKELDRIQLTQEDVIPLLDALYQLTPEDFETGRHVERKASLMLTFGKEKPQELLLTTDGEYVQFAFNENTARALGDETWGVKDDALNDFFADYLPLTDGGQWGVGLDVEDVNRRGATVVFRVPETGNVFTGSHFVLQTLSNGKWTDVPTLQEPIFTTEAISISNIRRFRIDWEWLYGELPGGQYRIGKNISRNNDDVAALPGVTPGSESAMVYAYFTLAHQDPTPYDLTNVFRAEGAGASAEFIEGGGGYNFFPEEVEELVEILNGLEEEDFCPAPGVSAQTIITLRNRERSLTLHSDGNFVEILSDGNAAEGNYATRNEALRTFFRKLNKHSQAESTYEIYNVAPLEELGDYYTIEEAVIDQVVVMVDGDVRYNQEVWMDFWAKTNRGQKAWVRCMHCYPEGDTFLYEVEFDRKIYTLRTLWEGEVTEESYSYLKVFNGVFPENAEADLFTSYILVNDDTATWIDLWQGLISSQYGAYIPHHIVYQDTETLPESSPSPVLEAVTPEMIVGIEQAELDWHVQTVITDPAILTRLEEMLRNSTLEKGIGCPTGNTLRLMLRNGSLLEIEMASDGCGVWKSGGVYYKFASGNEEFYSFFAAQVVHSRLYGGEELDALEDVLYYFSWNRYADLYGPDLTFSLMDYMEDWAKEQTERQKISMVLYRVEGLDGAYADYFGTMLNGLYEAMPEMVSQICLNYASGNVQETLISLLALPRNQTVEEIRTMLQSHLA